MPRTSAPEVSRPRLVCSACPDMKRYDAVHIPSGLMMLFHVAGSATFLADSIHALPQNSVVPPSLWEVHRHATRVLFETDLDRPPEIPAGALLGSQTPLSSLVPASTYDAASALWKQFKIALQLETLKPWFAGLVLANSLGGSIGFDPKFGIDRQIWQATSPDRRFVLEGIEALEVFDGAPSDEQGDYLAMIATTPDVVIDRLNRLHHYWQGSDAVGFANELLAAKQRFPKMFSGLIEGRNAAWLPAIVGLVNDPTQSLVLVGALHLVGPLSLPALLAQQGYKVSAI